ncbi:MAG: hypothetical protein ACKO96_40340 [Flammeovirgaceae bacterium]
MAKVLATYSGVNVEIKPTMDLSMHISDVAWKIDLAESYGVKL